MSEDFTESASEFAFILIGVVLFLVVIYRAYQKKKKRWFFIKAIVDRHAEELRVRRNQLTFIESYGVVNEKNGVMRYIDLFLGW